LAVNPKNGGSPPRERIIKINKFLFNKDIFVLLISVTLIKFNLKKDEIIGIIRRTYIKKYILQNITDI